MMATGKKSWIAAFQVYMKPEVIRMLFLGFSTDFRKPCRNLSHCSLNHSPITCPLMASASFDLSAGSFTTWKPASSVLNFCLCSSE